MIGTGVSKNNFIHSSLLQLRSSINSYLSSFSKIEEVSITVPKNTYLRTKLICEYIEDKLGVDFKTYDLVTILYLEFIENSIENYAPQKIKELINREYIKEDPPLIINDYGKLYRCEDKKPPLIKLHMDIDKKDLQKGQLLLDELEDLYRYAPSIEQLIAKIWMSFVEDYKTGKNKKALDNIKYLLWKHLYDEYEDDDDEDD